MAVQISIAITSTLHLGSYMRDSVVNRMLAGVLLFSIAYNVPLWIAYWPILAWNDRFNMTLFKTQTNGFETPYAYDVYRGIITLVFRAIPTIILITCNIIWIISAKRRMTTGVHLTVDNTNQLKVAVMSITLLTHVWVWVVV